MANRRWQPGLSIRQLMQVDEEIDLGLRMAAAGRLVPTLDTGLAAVDLIDLLRAAGFRPPVTVADFLPGRDEAELAGVAAEEPAEPGMLTRAELEERLPAFQAALPEEAPIKTGALRDSLTARLADDGSAAVWVQSPLEYPRIQDLGGLAGKDHSVLLAGHFYVAKAAAAADIPIEQATWSPTQVP